MEKIMVIANPKAGNESFKELEDLILTKLNEVFDEVEIRKTEKENDRTKFAREAADKKFDSICSFGGDGTVNEILKGLKDSDYVPKLQILPGGTGNILSQMFQISQNKRKAIENMSFDKYKSIDLGVVNDKEVFSIFLSLGAIPEAIHDVSNEEKTHMGFISYIKESISKLEDNDYFNLRVSTAKERYEGKVDHLLVSLTNKISFLEYSSKVDEMDSGNANVFLLSDNTNLGKLSVAKNALLGKVEEDENIVYMNGPEIKIESLDNTDIETDLDGEKGPNLPVNIKVLKEKIKVYLPENYRE